MTKTYPKVFLLFLGAFLLLNLLQSSFTQLIYDEAYYWYYSQNLSWGYFDHPPMVALFIWLGTSLFQGELGVRLISSLAQLGTILLVWGMIENKAKKKFIPHFFLLLFAMPLFNVYGFFTLPDTPLLFFTALFLFVYQSFLQRHSLLKALAMGLVMAALMYSKYHAILVILFVLLSNLKLLKNKYAWMAVGVALLAYTPHFIWLYEHDFVTVKYHIFERPNQPYNFAGFTLGYLLNLIVNFGLLFPLFYWALFKTKGKDVFTRGLLFLSYGVIFFFLFSSFQKRTQAQWVIVLCIPMSIMAYQFILNHAVWRKWGIRIATVSLVLFLYARAWLIYQPLLPKVFETHYNKEWVKKLNDFVKDDPVVFENSYRQSSMYHFYSGKRSFSLNNIFYRRNQYSIDGSEALFRNKRVAYLSRYVNSGAFKYVNPGGDTVYVNYKENFKPLRRLRCYTENGEVHLKDTNQLLKIYNPYPMEVALKDLAFKVSYLNEYRQIKELKNLEYIPVNTTTKSLKAQDTTYFKFTLKQPNYKNPSFLRFSISENGLPTGINSESIKITE